MHELSIVMSIVDIANKEAIKADVESFSKISLEIGSQSGIVMEALDFAWETGVKGSVLQQAKREIISIQAKAQCKDCNEVFEVESLYDVCPKCNSYMSEIIQGKELKILALEFESKN